MQIAYQKASIKWQTSVERLVAFISFAQNMGELNPLKKRSWTYSLNITFTPVGKVCESHKVLMVQKKKSMTPALARE